MDEGEGLKFPKTLMFDYPTIAAITELVRSQCSQPGEPEAVTRKVSARQSTGSTAVHGLACHLPSGWGLEECWSQWLESKDAIIQIPYARFDLHEVYDADAEARGASQTSSPRGHKNFSRCRGGLRKTKCPQEPVRLLE